MDISDLGEQLFSDAHRFLQCDAADPELRTVCHNSLRSLGFDLQRLEDLPIGIFLSSLVMTERLLRAGFCREEIIASGLVSDPRLAERLIGPIRNVGEDRSSVSGRGIPRACAQKYLFSRGSWPWEVPAFGLDVALPSLPDSACELLLVEDLLDALLLQSAGLLQVAATLSFSTNLARAQWEHLATLGIERVTLVPSNEREELTRATVAREASLQGGPAPEVFVLSPESFGHLKDLAEMIRAMSRDSFWSWVQDNRVPRTGELPAATTNVRPEAGDFVAIPPLPAVGRDSSAMQRPKELAIAPTPEPQQRRSSELCPLHHCDPMFCFCWD